MTAATEVRIRVNGVERSVPSAQDRTLLHVLRSDLDLTGAKLGCGEGECGACTVLLDGSPARACQVRLSELAGRAVVTVEGLASEGALSPVQRAFAEIGAFQCGYCTPGFVVAVTALLRARPDPSETEVRAALEGHLCRCCGYARILRAVARAAELVRAGGRP